MHRPPDEFTWNCPYCGRRNPQKVRACECRSGQIADDSVSNDELSKPRILLVVGVGIAALLMRSYLAPAAESPMTAPVTAAAAAPVVPVAVPLVAAAAQKSREDRARKRAVDSKKRSTQDSKRAETRRRSAVSPGFRFR
jgi:hypothetical protein